MYCIYLARLCVAHVGTEPGAGNIYLLTYQVQTSAFTWSARPSGQHQQPNNLLTGTSGNHYEVTSDAMESPCNSTSPTMATAGSDVSWTGNPLKRIVHWKMRPPFDRRAARSISNLQRGDRQLIGYAAQRQRYVFEMFLFHKDLVFSHMCIMCKALRDGKATSNLAE